MRNIAELLAVHIALRSVAPWAEGTNPVISLGAEIENSFTMDLPPQYIIGMRQVACFRDDFGTLMICI